MRRTDGRCATTLLVALEAVLWTTAWPVGNQAHRVHTEKQLDGPRSVDKSWPTNQSLLPN
jgi:hypothetical protein